MHRILQTALALLVLSCLLPRTYSFFHYSSEEGSPEEFEVEINLGQGSNKHKPGKTGSESTGLGTRFGPGGQYPFPTGGGYYGQGGFPLLPVGLLYGNRHGSYGGGEGTEFVTEHGHGHGNGKDTGKIQRPKPVKHQGEPIVDKYVVRLPEIPDFEVPTVPRVPTISVVRPPTKIHKEKRPEFRPSIVETINLPKLKIPNLVDNLQGNIKRPVFPKHVHYETIHPTQPVDPKPPKGGSRHTHEESTGHLNLGNGGNAGNGGYYGEDGYRPIIFPYFVPQPIGLPGYERHTIDKGTRGKKEHGGHHGGHIVIKRLGSSDED